MTISENEKILIQAFYGTKLVFDEYTTYKKAFAKLKTKYRVVSISRIETKKFIILHVYN